MDNEELLLTEKDITNPDIPVRLTGEDSDGWDVQIKAPRRYLLRAAKSEGLLDDQLNKARDTLIRQGRQEVIDWFDEHSHLGEYDTRSIDADDWQAQKKKWQEE